jgi:hypothetical protein
MFNEPPRDSTVRPRVGATSALHNSNDYNFEGFRVSKNPAKKYDAILRHKITKRLKHIAFGSRHESQYFDTIGHYKSQNNLDPERRRLYRLRHQHDNLDRFSPGFFSWYVL